MGLNEIIRNTYRTLMTRGQKGCYVYCEDEELSNYLKQQIQQSQMSYELIEEQFMFVAEEITEYGKVE